MRERQDGTAMKPKRRKPSKDVGGFEVFPRARFLTEKPMVRVHTNRDPHQGTTSIDNDLDPDEARRLAHWLEYTADQVEEQRRELTKNMAIPPGGA